MDNETQDSGADATGRWVRRAKKIFSRRSRLVKHGKSLANIYANAVRKRLTTIDRPGPGKKGKPIS
jgi:hypothetical protein